jgi:hypothetical protein
LISLPDPFDFPATELKIREDANGHLYYDQHVMKRKDPPSKQGVADESAIAPAGGSKDSIGQKAEDDKDKTDKHSRIALASAMYYAQDKRPVPVPKSR